MEEYLHYDSPLEGDLHELIPGKIVAFRGPQSLPDGRMYLDENGSRHRRTLSGAFYLGGGGALSQRSRLRGMRPGVRAAAEFPASSWQPEVDG